MQFAINGKHFPAIFELLFRIKEIVAINWLIFWQTDWLNTYHKKVQDTIGPLLINTNREAYDWMELRTRQITHAVSAASRKYFSLSIIFLRFTLFLCFNYSLLNMSIFLKLFYKTYMPMNIVLCFSMRLKHFLFLCMYLIAFDTIKRFFF